MTGFALKVIALTSMIIDHIGKVFYPTRAVSDWLGFYIPDFLMWIGRIAFPVYAFLIAEGCRKTRSMPKFIGRLALFSIISEAFYYMAFRSYNVSGIELVKQTFVSMSSLKFGNVFSTLMFGVIAVYVYQLLNRRKTKWLMLLNIPFLLLLMIIAGYCHTDYEGFGVILIFLLYIFQEKKYQTAVLLGWSTVLYLGWFSWNGRILMWFQSLANGYIDYTYIPCWIFACISAVLVYFYNGERGRKIKWAFYIAYPAHLLILVAVRELFIIL